MMSLRTIRRITKVTWASGVMFAACIGAAVGMTPQDAVVAIVGTSGATMLQVGVEWVFGGLFAFGGFLFTLVGVVLKVFYDRLRDLEKNGGDHEARLAAGGEQLKKLDTIEKKVDRIIEHGCARGCPSPSKEQQPSY